MVHIMFVTPVIVICQRPKPYEIWWGTYVD